MIKTFNKIAIFFVLVVFSAPAFSQTEMGKWRMHLAYNSVNAVAQTPNKIFAVSDGALFSIGKQDFDLELYSKISGLNGSYVSQIAYNTDTKQLIIIYQDGNIDLMSSGGIINVPDYYNKQLNVIKTVNHLYCSGAKAYLSTNFGILVLNLNKKEIGDTYYIGANATDVKVLSTTLHLGKIYAVSSSAIYYASLSSNLVDFHHWNTMTNLPGSGDIQTIASHAGYLILLRGGKVWFMDNTNAWSDPQWVEDIRSIKVSENRLYAKWDWRFVIADAAMAHTNVAYVGGQDITYDTESGKCWLAAGAQGLAVFDANTSVVSYYKPDGPGTNAAWNLTYSQGRVFAVPGNYGGNGGYGLPANIAIFENNAWTNITQSQIVSALGGSAIDFTNVAVDPNDKHHFYATSFGTGLYEFQNDAPYQRYTDANTGNIMETYGGTRTEGAIFDANSNLYFLNSAMTTTTVKVRTNAGTWHRLNYAGTNWHSASVLLINNQNPNQKWTLSKHAQNARGIVVFDDNATILDQSDDKSKKITNLQYINNGEISNVEPSYFWDITQDRNGVIWVATNVGPFLFHNTANVFNSDYLCSRVLIPRNDSTGFGDYLLDNVFVTSIAVDGANRKWLGTESSGAYLVSVTGVETIHHFTAENSPLPSNNVQSIAINEESGEVFFGTPNGIASFQSDAAEPQENYNNVRAYPNPVRENFEGIITITGLVANSIVRITDSNGNLVCHTMSNGSIATWNGCDTRGRKVNTGVYLVQCVDENNTLHTATKILIFK